MPCVTDYITRPLSTSDHDHQTTEPKFNLFLLSDQEQFFYLFLTALVMFLSGWGPRYRQIKTVTLDYFRTK